MDATTRQELEDCANRIRISSIEMTNASKSGHPTSSCSCAEIMAVLFFNEMHYDVQMPKEPSADRFVMSKGHACPALYAAWHETGHLSREQILSLRRIDSDIEGHPTPRLDFIDVATGSLGQGLSMAAGMAYTGKHFDKAAYRVYCLMGDGESAEGSIWEAAAFASHYKLDNLVGIIDVNRLGQSEATALGHDVDTYARRMAAFGWEAIIVDGHDVADISRALAKARATKGRPTALIAKTLKGKGITGIEDQLDWHGKPVGDKHLQEIRARLKNTGPIKLCVPPAPHDVPMVKMAPPSLDTPPAYKLGEKVATRAAYGVALAKLGNTCSKIVAMDGDTKNSTFAETFKKAHPDRFVECFIAEQNLVGVAIGCSTRNRTIPFCSTFAAFFTRAADQLRMGAVSMANIKCAGSHVGVSIGEDGPSQMGLEDIALFRSIMGSTVFYPSDGVSCERAVELAANTYGICFIRTSRPAMQTIYAGDEHFEVGQAKVVRQAADDQVVVIGAGVTLIEALAAADSLAKQGVNVCVIDPFTIKPLDAATIRQHVARCHGKVITVEDHYHEGGIGEAVAAVLTDADWSCGHAIRHRRIAVDKLPRSGAPDELMHMFGLSAKCIHAAVEKMLKQ